MNELCREEWRVGWRREGIMREVGNIWVAADGIQI